MQAERSDEIETKGTIRDAAEPPNFVYVLRCNDGSLYTGWTNRLEKRLKAHQDGLGAKYTRSRKPVELLCFWQFATAKEARRFEILFKRLSRAKKLAEVEIQRSLVDKSPFGKPLSI